jgi:GT2 family glycosyltransferase
LGREKLLAVVLTRIARGVTTVTRSAGEAPVEVALCICTRNRPGELRRALTSVAESSVEPAYIVVSDDSDHELQRETADACREFPHVTYVTGPCRGLSANRNNCLTRVPAETDVVLFIDDDVVVPREFIAAAVEAFLHAPEQTVVTGFELRDGFRVLPHNCSFWGHQEKPPSGAGDLHAICINATVFPRSLFDSVRFDELLRYGSDEIDICVRAEKAGFRVLFDPALFVYHERSPVNRRKYGEFQDASRLYATYKRYRWVEGRPVKAAVYAILAPAHVLVSVAVRGRRPGDVVLAFRAIATARRYAKTYRRSSAANRKAGGPDRSGRNAVSAA